MAKSLRSKREKRLRAIRREIVEPFYENKDSAKLAAQEAALAAPKLTVPSVFSSTTSMDMDTEMADSGSLKPVARIGKKLKKKFKMGKGKRRGKGKGKVGGKHNI